MTGTVLTLTGERAPGGRVLLVFCGGRASEHALPDSGIVVVGRGRAADVVIDHPTLSRTHAKLILATHMTIEDCGSHNGTTVGGRALTPGEVVLVAPGAPIELGDAMLIVRVGTMNADVLASSDTFLGKEPPLDRIVMRIAESDVSVLVAGEPGSGKTFLARRLHELSARRSGPFVVHHCGRDPGELKAAAASARGGVFFVQEPALLSAEGQSQLLETLVAERDAIRTVTATAHDPGALASRGAFSPDLVHRLAAVSIAVPPLRARLRELPALAESILSAVAAENGRAAPLLSSDALAALGRHAWPGNVRELRNALTRAVLLGSRRVLTAAHFNLDVADRAAGAGEGTLSSAVHEAEHRRIIEALRRSDGNQTRAAKMLGISRGTLIRRLELHAVPRPRK